MNQYAQLTMNKAQRDLLALLSGAGPSGAIVYGRAYAATAEALRNKGLVVYGTGVLVASMGKLETRHRYCLTDLGRNVNQ